jgi:beta-lactamase class A
MYEIVTNRAFNPEYSQALQQLLYWNLATEPRRNNDPNQGYFNPINTFFGENLPLDIEFYSKAGWTSDSRNEVAFIKTKDGKTAYILAVFAENSLYAKNYQIFPEISTLVYQKMRNL